MGSCPLLSPWRWWMGSLSLRVPHDEASLLQPQLTPCPQQPLPARLSPDLSGPRSV